MNPKHLPIKISAFFGHFIVEFPEFLLYSFRFDCITKFPAWGYMNTFKWTRFASKNPADFWTMRIDNAIVFLVKKNTFAVDCFNSDISGPFNYFR